MFTPVLQKLPNPKLCLGAGFCWFYLYFPLLLSLGKAAYGQISSSLARTAMKQLLK